MPAPHTTHQYPHATFQYTYSEKFGTDPQGEQDTTDKIVLKRLSQVHKESTLSFRNLLKKLQQETYRTMNLDKPSKDSLAENLSRTQHTHHYTAFRTRQGEQGIQGKEYQGGTIQESIRLEPTQYSSLTTRQEQTHYTLDIKTIQYKEDCSLTPPCQDCRNNAQYSSCDQRKPLKHTHHTSTTLANYWALALFGKTRPQTGEGSTHPG